MKCEKCGNEESFKACRRVIQYKHVVPFYVVQCDMCKTTWSDIKYNYKDANEKTLQDSKWENVKVLPREWIGSEYLSMVIKHEEDEAFELSKKDVRIKMRCQRCREENRFFAYEEGEKRTRIKKVYRIHCDDCGNEWYENYWNFENKEENLKQSERWNNVEIIGC